MSDQVPDSQEDFGKSGDGGVEHLNPVNELKGAIWSWDLDKDEVSYSKGWFEIVGFGPSDFGISADVWRQLMHPEDL